MSDLLPAPLAPLIRIERSKEMLRLAATKHEVRSSLRRDAAAVANGVGIVAVESVKHNVKVAVGLTQFVP
jgi:hypothetical protein